MSAQAYYILIRSITSVRPKTLTEAIRHYSDEQICIDAVAALRWQDGKPVCPKCCTAEGDRKHYWLKTQKRWKCYSCRKQFSVKVGTIFEDSPLSLDIWMVALWMLCNCRNGVSSYEIARATGIAQKSAWFVLSRLRLVLKDLKPVKLGGPEATVQMDECYTGGIPQKMHKSRRLKLQLARNEIRKKDFGGVNPGKTAVFGMIESGTKQVRAMVLPNVKRVTLMKTILDNVGFGSTIHTDMYPGYQAMPKEYIHETVNHMREYVTETGVHTQSIENYWSVLKRTLQGTYVAVEPFHMDRYLDEQCFRFNHRLGYNDGTRFQKALSQVADRRLTWSELTGKESKKSA